MKLGTSVADLIHTIEAFIATKS